MNLWPQQDTWEIAQSLSSDVPRTSEAMSLISRATNMPRLTAPESGVPGKMGTKGKAISNLCKSAYGPKAKDGNIYTRSQMFLGKNCDGFSAGAPTQFVTSSQSAVREVPNHLYPTTGVFPTANSQYRTTSPQIPLKYLSPSHCCAPYYG